ncbi:MAG: hypothetical protein JO314_14160, partial [Acidobacteria bacterium]|nr:hypothetical protein [Acidobacteriota bacterium]
EPRPTSAPQGFPQPQQQGWNVQPQQQYSMQPPKKSSNAWIWVLLILGAIILVCGGGIIGAFVYIGKQAQEVANAVANGNYNASRGSKSSNSTTTKATNTNSSRTTVETLDLNNWVPDHSQYASVECKDDELLVKNNDPKYYYVLAGTSEQKTVGADAVITVKNVDNSDTNLGYGLVFHSMTTPLIQGYAFAIDSKKGRYRVVHHSPAKEAPVINWTRSDAIKTGTSPNTLEARDNNGTVDLYINGQKVNSIPNTYGYSDGVIGIYASSGIQVAFTDMQLRH